jgi:hypothetical protein
MQRKVLPVSQVMETVTDQGGFPQPSAGYDRQVSLVFNRINNLPELGFPVAEIRGRNIF